jgi:hypothetical protein
MVDLTPLERRDIAVTRIRRARVALQDAVESIPAEIAFKGSEWCVADAMRHIGGKSGYLAWAQRLVAEGSLDLPSFPSWEEAWKRMINDTLKTMEDAANFAEGLSADDLQKVAHRGDERLTVADLLEGMANHYEEHVKQIRDEMQPRLGLGKA